MLLSYIAKPTRWVPQTTCRRAAWFHPISQEDSQLLWCHSRSDLKCTLKSCVSLCNLMLVHQYLCMSMTGWLLFIALRAFRGISPNFQGVSAVCHVCLCQRSNVFKPLQQVNLLGLGLFGFWILDCEPPIGDPVERESQSCIEAFAGRRNVKQNPIRLLMETRSKI